MTRPRYIERGRVTAEGLAAEQSQLLASARRHRAGGHTWGIVAGLALIDGHSRVLVQPGVAIDGYGRELVLPAAVAIDGADLGPDAELWLLYGRVADTPPQPGRRACGSGRHSRWSEAPCLRVTVADDALDPRDPPGLDAGAHAFAAADDAPDASAPVWPVLLGRVTKNKGGFWIDPSRRPYAGLAGESITHPRGEDAIRLDGAFAVRTGAREPLVVDADRVTLAADTTAASGLTVGSATFGATPAPEAAAPWRAYRTGADLRVEIEHPGDKGDPGRRALSVLYDDEGPQRRLTVLADGTAIVGGELVVEGLLNPGPIAVDPDDPRFRAALVDRWLGGITTAGGELVGAFSGAVSVSIVALTGNVLAQGASVSCTVRVTNTGNTQLGALLLGASLRVGGTVKPHPADPFGVAFSLAPGQFADRAATFTGFTVGDLVSVHVAVGGAGPGGRVVTADTHGCVSIHPIFE